MSLRPQWNGYHTNPNDQRQSYTVQRAYEAPFRHADDLAVRQRELGWIEDRYNNTEDLLANRMLYPRPPPTLAGNSRIYVRGEPTAPYPYA